MEIIDLKCSATDPRGWNPFMSKCEIKKQDYQINK